MARGWESKSVEDQIASKDDRAVPRPALTAADRERQARLEGLRLARAKAVADLAMARDARHRALLEKSLEFLDNELAKGDA